MRIGSIRLPGKGRSTAMLAWAASLVALASLALGLSQVADAAPGNVSATVHNLSRTGTGTIKAPAGGETEICAFCHTPHAASTAVKAPLWNRAAAGSTYTRYTSSSLDANAITDGFSAQPGGSSVLCLSCHDGLLALGNVNVLRGAPATIALDNTDAGKMHAGSGTNTAAGSSRGALTGYTRVLGDDLSNDHPISITFNDALAARDGEIQRMTTAGVAQRDTATSGNTIAVRGTGTKPLLPLEPTGKDGLGQVQCATCHDPHLNKEKFLRLNRYQVVAPSSGDFSEAGDQICLACHRKLGLSWAQSAHANVGSASYVYKDEASDLRGFTRGKKVWEVACLNCHDTHTASGSRRLLREGTGTSANAGPASFQAGSATRPVEKVSSIENTCYQCHNTTTASILTTNTMTETTGVPNIKSEFDRTYRMPIKTSEQFGTGNTNDKEVHDITDADFMETQANLGRGNTMNRHVECTDCHNPHRVIKNSLFNGDGDANRRIHTPSATLTGHPKGSGGNIASGALRGAWGVEPSYTAANQTTVTVSGTGSAVTGTKWPENPTFEVKKGDPGQSKSTARTETYLTREYQLCFKCHSNYANSDVAAEFPALGNTGGGTPPPPATGCNSHVANCMQRYTNVAAEFAVRATDPPSTGTDQGEATNAGTACNGGNCTPVGSYPRGLNSGNGEVNHRSWHPVVFPTGRDRAERSMNSTGAINMRPPWDTNLGLQTMQCSDCHGSSVSYTQYSGPNLNQVQGPHGSDTPFLLKGTWNLNVKLPTPGADTLCGKCHDPTVSSGGTGFYSDHAPDDKMGGEPCMYCHIAVPHGWKNKAFLVNLRCVGHEVPGSTGDCTNRGSGTYGSTTIAPYYISSRLRVSTWARSGGWSSAACGGGTMEDSCPRTGG